MSSLKRRTFLSTVAAGAASTAVPAAPLPQAGPKRFRLGFIGLGRRGRGVMAAALQNPETEVVAICDVYEPNLELGRKMAPDARVYRDFREVLAAGDIDAVGLGTPDHWHAYMTVEACKAGKDVYVEKPISVTVHEGQMMVKAARKYNRIVQVGTQQRSGKHFEKAVDIVRSGKLGEISFVRTWNYGNEFPEGIGNPPDTAPPDNLDWDMWLGPAPERPFNKNRFGVDPNHYSYFRWFWDYAGGMMTDWGVHLLDIVLWAMDEKGPRVITTVAGKYAIKDNRETPDTIQATYEFPGFACVYENRVANGQSMWNQNYGILFHGTEGTLFVDRSRWEILPETRTVEPGGSQRIDRLIGERGSVENDTTVDHWADFVSAMKTRKPPKSDIEIGHRSTATCLLANVALRSRQRIEWNPDTETTDNKEAQSYLKRDHRAPWELKL
ncbi:MAG TPA: Gfo/Idh/MocA family oxidoreductase [Bryobacterales bacterium]|nr:Gfo/Idh/MocA family oxidoreductase [Bryobacterales bacterium]